MASSIYHFEEALQTAQQSLGGNGYLSNDSFRDYFNTGRILPRHLDAVLKPRALSEQIKLGVREITHMDVLRACMLADTAIPAEDRIEAQLARHPDRHTIAALAESSATGGRTATGSSERGGTLGVGQTELLASWCDRTLGTQIDDQLNREMVKWCEAFLDEGHATWKMPHRDKGFYTAWKFLGQREWSPCGIKNNRKQLACLPAQAEDSLIESIGVLGIRPDSWQDYFSAHLAALSGWTGFIKWRADQGEYEWQSAYPIDLVQYLAVRLWYERELVHQACRDGLAIDGNLAAINRRDRKTPRSIDANIHHGQSDPRGHRRRRLAAGPSGTSIGVRADSTDGNTRRDSAHSFWTGWTTFRSRHMAPYGSRHSKRATKINCWRS